MTVCPAAARILEIQTQLHLLNKELSECENDFQDWEKFYSLLETLPIAIHDLNDWIFETVLEKRTFVKVLRGPCKEKIGTISGTISDRKKLMGQGLTKAIIKIDDAFYTLELADLHELSKSEQILMGLI